MLRELFDAICLQERKANDAKIVRSDGDPRTEFVVYNGELKERAVPPPLRDHRVATLRDLIETAGMYGTADDASIWHDDGKVVLVVDEGDRREFVTLPLRKGRQFAFLCDVDDGDGMDLNQSQLIKIFRFSLGSAAPRGLVDIFRRVDFKRTSSGAATVEHGRESLGKSVEAEVTAAQDIPDSFDVSVPIWTTDGAYFAETVKVGVEIDVAHEKFILCPLPNEIVLAQARANQRLHDAIAEGLTKTKVSNVAVFNGTP